MSSKLLQMLENGDIDRRDFSFPIDDSLVLECTMGSTAYGANTGSSDVDIHCIIVPPRRMVFPHLQGHIRGFGPVPESFDNYQKHHIKIEGEEPLYDVVLISIVKFFDLCAKGNPNTIELLAVDEKQVNFNSPVGELMRKNVSEFFSTQSIKKMIGFATSEFKSIEKEYYSTGTFNLKSAYHAVRLLNQAKQILTVSKLDLKKASNTLIDIKSGKWHFYDFLEHFLDLRDDISLIECLSDSDTHCDMDKLQTLLHQCLAIHYCTVST